MQVVRLPNGSFHEAFVTIPAGSVDGPAALFQRLGDFLADNPSLRIVRQDVFGLGIDPHAAGGAQNPRLDPADWPVTWIEEGNGDGGPVAGLQAHAVAGVPTRPLRLDGRLVGSVFEDDAARYCVLGDMRPASAAASRAEQTRHTFELMEAGLDLAGMDFSQVVRTWFYLDDILEWYGEFNAVRNQFFRERGVFDRLVPASTGVGGGNAAGTGVVANLLAIQPKQPGVSLAAVPSPLQCPALEYGSSFSRAVELSLPGQSRLYISGTASIAPDGSTVHVGDIARQIQYTMEVVGAILESRCMEWQHVTRAIGYLKHTEDAPAFVRYCREHHLPRMPVIVAKNDICRDDLLFEIEADAARLE